MIWTIEPSDGVTNLGNGSFTFPENASITQYTITCDNEAGCTATTIYNLPQDCGDTPTPPTPPGPQPDPECIRGTDNGNDVIGGVTYPHPFLCCGGGKDSDMDSLYVQTIFYNGNPISESSSNPTRINDWLSVYRTTTGGVVGYGALFYRYGANNTSKVLETNITFTTNDTNVHPDSSPAKKYHITNACPSWTVTVKQCREGYLWCCHPSEAYDGECHSYTAYEERCGQCSGDDKEIESCGGDCN